MSNWHPTVEQVHAWIAGSGGLDAISIEQHMPSCEECRVLVADSLAASELKETWQSIRDRLEPQPLNFTGRILVKLGMTPGNAFLVSSTPSLSNGWLTGIAVALVFAIVGAALSGTRGVAFFLFIAPMAPLAGMAFAFGGDNDPLFELTLAAPYSKFRLLLWRSLAVLATTIPMTVAAALVAGLSWWAAAVWLVPALAFCAITLALAGWVEPAVTATALGLGWFLIQSIEFAREGPTLAYAGEALVVYAVAGAAAVVMLVIRRTDTVALRIR